MAEADQWTERVLQMYEIALSVIHCYSVVEHYPAIGDRDRGAHGRRILDLLATIPRPQRAGGARPERGR